MNVIFAAALVPSLALASIPAADGTFTGCLHDHARELRLIDASRENCRRNEKQVTWNGNGPSGAAVTAVPLSVGDPMCPAGGTKFIVQGAVTYACNGTPGAPGAAGPQGPQGTPGQQGPQGMIGFMGPVGPVGPMGQTGPMGAMGPVGPVGPVGATGPMGPQGPMGIPGPMGPSGVDGLPGLQGTQGPGGPTGPQGAAGPSGAQGPKGDAGDAGAAGPQGQQGAQGPQGPAGQSVALTALAAGDLNCPNGGVAVNVGSDAAYVCSAPQGSPLLVDAAAIQQINGWAGLPSNTAWSLCYKATRDNAGLSFATSGSLAFHSRCDGRGRTFFVAKSSVGTLFGGYATQPWGSKLCTYKNDPSAFLFSLTNAFRHALSGNAAIALYDCQNSGPGFGGGNDFITNLKDQASANLGYTYACRVGSGSQCTIDYAGMSPIMLVELEVYAAP
jgi:hypothetical protein